MSESKMEPKPQKPTEAYIEARQSVMYSLSELMFGSLLASYILGFIGFSAFKLPIVTGGPSQTLISMPLDYLPIVFIYLFISLTFSYISAAVYITYHTTVLLMPTTAFARLSQDFLVALLHAVLFGLSMLMPIGFPVFLAAVVLSAEWRRRLEFNKFTELKTPRPDRDDEKPVEKFRRAFKEKATSSPYKEWVPNEKMLFFSSAILIFGTIVAAICFAMDVTLTQLPIKGLGFWLVLVFYLVIFISVFLRTRTTLKEGASFLKSESAAEKKIDIMYDEIMEHAMQMSLKK